MKSIQKSVLIWYSPGEMFRLVADVPQYPQFLPWCDRASVIETHADGVSAELGLQLGVIRHQFTTRNTHKLGPTDAKAHSISLGLLDGPFSELKGAWKFDPVGNGSQRASRVSLELRYAFSSSVLQATVGPMFDTIAANLINAFVARAEAVYGD
jgi:ribosome-associated toxin RatA of RatAB toxin-antitoxin module